MPSSGAVFAAPRAFSARLTAGRRMLPSFLVVGTKRGGSTSLYQYIASHPDVQPCRAKKGTHYFDVNFSRGWRWFRSSFPLPRVGTITGEASPYYMFHPLAAQRIAEALPDVKLVVVLRDPVERAYSHWSYETRRGFESLPIEAALDAEPTRLAGEVERMTADGTYQSAAHRHHTYLARGHYAEQLDALGKLVSRERLHVLQSEAMYADPDTALAPVWAALGLRPHRLGAVSVHKAGDYSPMPAPVRERLAAHYAAHNERLYAMPGIGFRWPDWRSAVGSPSAQPGSTAAGGGHVR